MGKIIIKKKPSTETTSPKCLNCGKVLSGRRTKFCCTGCKQSYYEDVKGYASNPYEPSARKFYV